MARSMLKLALIGALLMTGANASMYLDQTMTFFTALNADPSTIVSDLLMWALYVVWYSLAPLVAPILGSIVDNLFSGNVTIDMGGTSLDAAQAFAVVNLHSGKYAFNFLMNLVPKVLLDIVFPLLSLSSPAPFNSDETTLCELLGFSGCQFF